MPREEYVRTEAIRALIERDLQPIRTKWTLDMNFKLDPEDGGTPQGTGLYRIDVNMGERSVSSYDRFSFQLRADGWKCCTALVPKRQRTLLPAFRMWHSCLLELRSVHRSLF